MPPNLRNKPRSVVVFFGTRLMQLAKESLSEPYLKCVYRECRIMGYESNHVRRCGGASGGDDIVEENVCGSCSYYTRHVTCNPNKPYLYLINSIFIPVVGGVDAFGCDWGLGEYFYRFLRPPLLCAIVHRVTIALNEEQLTTVHIDVLAAVQIGVD